MADKLPSKLDDLLLIRSRPLSPKEIEYIQIEAAQAIAALTADNEALREALQEAYDRPVSKPLKPDWRERAAAAIKGDPANGWPI